MNETIAESGHDAGAGPAERRHTPVHLWIVGALSLLWNAMGAFDYTMTESRNPRYLSGFGPDELAYFESFPAWTVAVWALGVWGAVAGSVLLLMRSRHAVLAFLVSVVGLALTTVWQFLLSAPPQSLRQPGMLAFNLAIWAVAILLLFYANRMKAKGILR